jgi:transcriptional regulator with XRE-family HTH domain
MAKGPPIASRLKQARLRAGLSQKQLGVAAGIDQFSASPRINQYERGKHVPDYGTVSRLAAVLRVPVPVFYTQDEEMAELILQLGNLSRRERRRLLTKIVGRSTRIK